MSNRIAVILGITIIALLAIDLLAGWGATLFLARKFTDFIEWMAFWR